VESETANREKNTLSPSPHSYKAEGSSARKLEVAETLFAESPDGPPRKVLWTESMLQTLDFCCETIKKVATLFQTHSNHVASSSGNRTKS
jgi:hypothetical protein